MTGAQAQDDNRNNGFSLAESLANGRFSVELRPRWNDIRESDKPERTQTGTIRAIAGWRSAPWQGLRLTVELIHADHFAKRGLNDDPARLFTSPYPLLPDPRHTGTNQVFLDYAGVEGLRVRAGRQRLRIGDQRWVSDNDFRQVPQLFDGVTATYDGIADTEVMGGYYRRLRGTSGEVERLRLGVLHAAWSPVRGHAFAAFGYFHDQADNNAFTGFANESHKVMGVRAEGVVAGFAALEVPYTLEVARQRPHAGGDARIRASYWRAGAGLGAADWTVRYDQEVKGSNGGVYGLQMPLTDFYAFNGWALHFFNTPPQGLVDRWVTVRLRRGAFTLYAEAHRFRSDFRDLDFGRETDVGLTWEIVPEAVLRLQHARYAPGSGQVAPDIRKTWLTLSWSY